LISYYPHFSSFKELLRKSHLRQLGRRFLLFVFLQEQNQLHQLRLLQFCCLCLFKFGSVRHPDLTEYLVDAREGVVLYFEQQLAALVLVLPSITVLMS
jgi:hypothetical protein